MNSCQNSFYDRYKDRRNGSLFFSALATILGFIPAIGLTGLIFHSLFPGYEQEIVVAVGVLLCLSVLLIFVRFCKAVAAARQWRREKAQLSKLSSDELIKARSKLLKHQNRGSL